MKYLYKKSAAVFILLLSIFLVACEEGDSKQLSQLVTLADLEIESIEVTPSVGRLKTGYSYQYVASGIKIDGVRIDISDLVDWNVSDIAIATISDTGMVTTIADGTVDITASLSTISAVASLTTSSAAIQGFVLSAEDPTPDACSNTQLKVVGDYGSGDIRNAMPITNFVTWNIADTDGSVNTTGYLKIYTNTAFSMDIATVVGEATVPTTGDSLTINVQDNLTSISVTPVTSTINVNETLQYTANGTFDISGTPDVRNITQNVNWSTDPFPSGVAAFESATKGLVTAKQQSDVAVNIVAECGTDTNDNNVTLTVFDDTFIGVEIVDAESDETIENEIVLIEGALKDYIDVKLIAMYQDSSKNENVTDSTDPETVWTKLGSDNAVDPQVITVGGEAVLRIKALTQGSNNVKGEYNGRRDQILVEVQ